MPLEGIEFDEEAESIWRKVKSGQRVVGCGAQAQLTSNASCASKGIVDLGVERKYKVK